MRSTSTVESAIEEVARTLADPRHVAHRGVDATGAPAARADSLEGNAGVALFFAELARRDRAWLRTAHAHVSVAAQALTDTSPSVGLHMGPAAVLAAVQACAPHGGHYPTLRRRLVTYLADEQRGRVAAERAAGAARGGGVRWAGYDAIAGLSGTGRLLLSACLEGGAEERAASGPALRDTLTYLTGLSRPVSAHGREVPGWWVPEPLLVMDFDRERYPRGEFNVGMAHGISGPLTLLGLCAQHGIRVPGQDDALQRIGGWLANRTRTDPAGPHWPARIAFDEEVGHDRGDDGGRGHGDGGAGMGWGEGVGGRGGRGEGRVRSGGDEGGGGGRGDGGGNGRGPDAGEGSGDRGRDGAGVERPSWCYGTPGIAAALYLAGQVSDEPGWQLLARTALHALPHRHDLSDPRHPHRPHRPHHPSHPLHPTGDPLPSPIVCHGQAGLLQAAWRLGRATGDASLLGQAATAGRRILELADPDAPFGFPSAPQPVPGILQGAAGIGAALLSLVPNTSDPYWDRVLLLS
ncbi:lanthionine synthetase LanC family protein [Actinomycetota bacterium Odt1-20B]